MVATNLAAHAASRGLTVGLMDADIYGPNIPVMFGEERRPAVAGAKGSEMIVPLEAHGVRLMSLGFLLEREQPAIMRGPLIAGILKQFMEQVSWGRLDLMIVDMPPGTGDAQLSLVQTVDLDGALMVTTPQKVATGDVRRGVKMFERVNTRVMGIVENMCGFRIPGTDEVLDLFGRGGWRRAGPGAFRTVPRPDSAGHGGAGSGRRRDAHCAVCPPVGRGVGAGAHRRRTAGCPGGPSAAAVENNRAVCHAPEHRLGGASSSRIQRLPIRAPASGDPSRRDSPGCPVPTPTA